MFEINLCNLNFCRHPQLVSTYGDNRIGNLGGQDPYGINTVSAFGNYPVYAQEKVAQLAAKGNLTPFQQQKLDFYQQVVDEETARIDRDYPGGTTFDFADYEQDTGGGGGTGTMKLNFLMIPQEHLLIMPNGKPPKTTGEHLVSLYGYVTGFKKQIDHLHQDLSKLERKTDTVIYWIVGGAFTTILTLVGLFNLFIN